MAQDDYRLATPNAAATAMVGDISPVRLAPMTERQRENMGITIAVVLMFVVLMFAAQTEQGVFGTDTTPIDTNPSPVCEEDENWVSTHYQNPDGVEDGNGVTRWCLHADSENWVPTHTE